MTRHKLAQSDRRIILLLMGILVITATVIVLHTPQRSGEPHKRFNRDSLVLKKRQDSIRRADRYRTVQDSFARLKAERELRKRQREARYQTLMDSFAQLKARRLEEKAAREKERAKKDSAWRQHRDSLRSLHPHKLAEGETLDPNACDSTALLQVPGIGSHFAGAIIRYRTRLGGFHRIGQLSEIPNFPAQSLPYFRITNEELQRINVNTASFSKLMAHPYVNFRQAKALTAYRNRYGRIENLEQLALMEEFAEEDLLRLAPYVTF
ncbi:MAG: helix-hairpin-helix domain-containing protein [Bacteroidaceae bacterium]|nr:helix-hairpin-helix domain-containing protein [Bacteroidaceae bacterium]